MTVYSNSKTNLSQLENQYSGERIFIIGNGPSLAETPLDKLDSEYTFALNRINHIYDDVDWRPDFYLFLKNSMSDDERKFIEENIKLGCTCFINEKYATKFGKHNTVHYIRRKKLHRDPLTTVTNGSMTLDEVDTKELMDVWSADISKGVYKKHSMYPTLQIAAFLGFGEIYLLGCDLGFEVQKPYLIFEEGIDPARYINKREFLSAAFTEQTPVRSLINGVAFKCMLTYPVDLVLSKTTDLYQDDSHFTESYEGRIRFKDVNEEIMNSHRVAKMILEDNDINIFNSTLGGELEVHPRVKIEEVI